MIVGILFFQALWIALSGRYPMAFDEDFHLGLIKIYSSHLSPFWESHPAGADAYGAISRDPSYLYHLALGAVYRLIRAVSSDIYYQVLTLRLINISLFAGGLFVFKLLLGKTKMSPRLINYILLVFVLIPVVPLLAAQINYDNLIFPLVGLVLLNTLAISEDLKRRQPNLINLSSFSALIMATSIVKYAFLPIALACLGFLFIYNRKQLKSFFTKQRLKKAYGLAPKMLLGTLLLFNLIFAGLVLDRYGLNLVNYHKPVADCAEVLNFEKCQAYGPWIRDYNFEKTKPKDANTSVFVYIPEWVYGMWFRSFFSVDGPGTLNQTRGPLILPAIVSVVLLVASPAVIILAYKRIANRYSRQAIYLFSAVIVIYISSLWLEEFRLFRKTAQPVAINGRYLVLIMPLLFSLIAMSFSELIAKPKVKYILATVVLFMLIWGGGALTYVLRSNPAWYWPNNAAVKHINWTAQRTIGPIVPGYYISNFLQN